MTALQDCRIDSHSAIIRVLCDSSDSSVIGYQVIAQRRVLADVKKLYVSQNTELGFEVALTVDNNGTYRVTVLTIRSGSGIINACPYTEQLQVLIGEGKELTIHVCMLLSPNLKTIINFCLNNSVLKNNTTRTAC
jgi:hypothetical protein